MAKIGKIHAREDGQLVEVVPELAQSAVNDGAGRNIETTYASKEELTDGSVTKVMHGETIGSESRPIFLKEGVPTVVTGEMMTTDTAQTVSGVKIFNAPTASAIGSESDALVTKGHVSATDGVTNNLIHTIGNEVKDGNLGVKILTADVVRGSTDQTSRAVAGTSSSSQGIGWYRIMECKAYDGNHTGSLAVFDVWNVSDSQASIKYAQFRFAYHSVLVSSGVYTHEGATFAVGPHDAEVTVDSANFKLPDVIFSYDDARRTYTMYVAVNSGTDNFLVHCTDQIAVTSGTSSAYPQLPSASRAWIPGDNTIFTLSEITAIGPMWRYEE